MFPNKFQGSNNSKAILLLSGVSLTIIVILFIFVLINDDSDGSVSVEGETLPNMDSLENKNSPVFQVDVIEEGGGYKSKIGDVITVHYTGKLQNDSVFDSSVARNEPFSFELGASTVIEGWDLGLIDVSEGTRLTLTIPPELAYGDRTMPGIPANSTLIFEIEVLGIAVASQ